MNRTCRANHSTGRRGAMASQVAFIRHLLPLAGIAGVLVTAGTAVAAAPTSDARFVRQGVNARVLFLPPPPQRFRLPAVEAPIPPERVVPRPTVRSGRPQPLVRTPYGDVSPETARRLDGDRDDFITRESTPVHDQIPDEARDSDAQSAWKWRARRVLFSCVVAGLRKAATSWLGGRRSFADIASASLAACISAQFQIPLRLGVFKLSDYLINVGLPAVAHAAQHSPNVANFRNWLHTFP